MKQKLLTTTATLLLATAATAANSTTTCQGSTYTNDGFNYQNVTLIARFEEEQGYLELYADGENDKLEFDLNNRFPHIEFEGTTKKNSKGRIVLAKMAGEYLPNHRKLNTQIDMTMAQSKSKVSIERTDGTLIKALLSCQTTLEPVCHKEIKCRDHCSPRIGCENSCESNTVCEAQEF